MSPKKMIDWIKDPNRPLYQRTFVLMTLTAFATLSLITVWDIFIGESILKLSALVIALIALYVIIVLSIKFKNTQVGAIIVSISIILYVLPVEFFTGDGVYGCTPIWYVYAFMYVGVNVQGFIKYPLLVGVPASAVTCYLVAYYNTSLLTNHDMKTAYLDSIASLIGVGSLLYFSVTFMIDLYRSENELSKRQKEEIAELSKAQNRFFSSMSHEIRTPINTIIGLNEMTLRDETISEEIADNSRNIRSASKMLLTTINDLLDISKIESGKMDIVSVEYDLGDMLSDIVGMSWHRAREKGLEFHVDVDQNCPTKFYGDEVRIKQIIINLLTNAIKYSKKGSVTLSVRCRQRESSRVIIVFSVADTGMGIKKESMPYLFTAFKRVDEDKNRYIEGTGLGLSIVKQFVDMMGGTISVNSVYTKGSTFIVELPQEVVDFHEIGELNLEARHALGKREHYKQSFEAPGANVLVVDDNETNILVATKLLRGTKVNIDTAASGRDALRLTLQKHYDTIFMDHLMPEMDGIQCLHAIREQLGGLNTETPVVILTANAGSENQALYTKEGFDGYLLKPVSGNQLESELLRHLPSELVTITGMDTIMGEEGLSIKKHRHKVSVMITSESLCDLPEDVVKRFGIGILPHCIQTERGWFLDGEEIEAEGLVAYMEEGGVANSEPQGVEEIESFFADQLVNAQHIIHISLAKKVSDSYERALEASKTFDNVTVVDSGSLSTGLGLVVTYAAKRAAEDASVEEILKELKGIIRRTRMSFEVSSTEYMYRCGRMKRGLHQLCKSFMIHPIIGMRKSDMKLTGLHVGTREASWRRYIRRELSDLDTISDEIIYIVYVALTPEELEFLRSEVESRMKFKQIIFKKASPTISTNCGPGSIGLSYLRKEN